MSRGAGEGCFVICGLATCGTVVQLSILNNKITWTMMESESLVASHSCKVSDPVLAEVFSDCWEQTAGMV